MKNLRRGKSWVALIHLTSLLAVGLFSVPAWAFVVYQNGCGNLFKWQYQPYFYFNNWGGYPFTEIQFWNTIQRSLKTWRDVPISGFYPNLSSPGSPLTSYVDIKDGRNDILYVPSQWSLVGESTEAAVTYVYWKWEYCSWWTRDYIAETDIYLNGVNYLWADGAMSGRLDLESVLTHELGHAGVLGHTDYAWQTLEPGSPYFEFDYNTTWRRTIHWDDIAGIRYLYPDRYLYPSSYVYTDSDRLVRGETVYFDTSTWKGYGANYWVDIYFGLTGPWDNQVRYLTWDSGWSMTPVPFLSNWMVQDIDVYFLFYHIFSSVDPTGDYTFYVALYVPGAGVKDIRNYEPNRYWRHSVKITLSP